MVSLEGPMQRPNSGDQGQQQVMSAQSAATATEQVSGPALEVAQQQSEGDAATRCEDQGSRGGPSTMASGQESGGSTGRGYGALEETSVPLVVNGYGPEPPTLDGTSLQVESTPMAMQAEHTAETTSYIGRAQEARSSRFDGLSSQQGFFTPRSRGSATQVRPAWWPGFEVPAWAERLGSLIGQVGRTELTPSPLAGSTGTPANRTSPPFRLRPPTQSGRSPGPPPTPPSSSSIGPEVVQAEVQRQLGGLLEQLRKSEELNQELMRELSRVKTEAEARTPWTGAAEGDHAGLPVQGPCGSQGAMGLHGLDLPQGFPQGVAGGLGQAEPLGPPLPRGTGDLLSRTESPGPTVSRGAGGIWTPSDQRGQPSYRGMFGAQGTSVPEEPREEPSRGLLQSLLGARSRSPTPPQAPAASSTSDKEVLTMLAKSMQQLQELQARAMSKRASDETVQEIVKPGTTTLAELPDLKPNTVSTNAAIMFQDWVEVSTSVMADISEQSGEWWRALLEGVNKVYLKWLAATPLERLSINPDYDKQLCQGRWVRVNARVCSMMLSAMTDTLRSDMVSQRITHSAPRMMFRLYVLFQPGGSAERQDILSKLQNPAEHAPTDKLEDVLAVVRKWPRWLARCQSVGMTPPDATVLVRGLTSLTSRFVESSTDISFRTAMLRTTLRLEAQPTLEQAQAYQKHLQAELETMSTTTTAASSVQPRIKAVEAMTSGAQKGKEKSQELCRYFARSQGCKRGSRCTYSHSMAAMDRETRARKCLQCGSEAHRQRECPVGKPGAKAKAGPGNPDGDSNKGSPKKEQTTPSASLNALQPTSPGDPIPGVPWTLEALVQAAQQVVQGAQPSRDEDKSPEKTSPSLKTLMVRDIRVCSQRVTSSALLDSGATHCLRTARTFQEWWDAEEVLVQLAGNHTLRMRITETGTLLMAPQTGSPEASTGQTIVPLGELVKTLGYTLVWGPNGCFLEDPRGHQTRMNTSGGCPHMCEAAALALIARLEDRKREQLENASMVTGDRLEVAAAALDRSWFDYLRDYVRQNKREDGLRALRDAPFFEDVPGECLGDIIPENLPDNGWSTLKQVPYLSRPQRRRLLQAKRWVVHLFAGEEEHRELHQLDQGDDVLLELDIRRCRGHDLRSSSTWNMLLWGAREGKIDLLMGAPPGRFDKKIVENKDCRDLRLLCRMLWLYSVAVAARVARTGGANARRRVGFILEHPSEVFTGVQDGKGSEQLRPGVWSSEVWQSFAEETGQVKVTFDQKATGSTARSPTTLGTNILYLQALDGLGSETTTQEAEQHHCRTSRWSPGLVKALVVAAKLWAKVPTLQSISEDRWKAHINSNHQPYRRDCITCVMSKGTGRKHARVAHPDSFVLTADVAGPLKPGLDPINRGSLTRSMKYMVVAKYVFPKEYLKGYAGVDPPDDDGMPAGEEPQGEGLEGEVDRDPGHDVGELMLEGKAEGLKSGDIFPGEDGVKLNYRDLFGEDPPDRREVLGEEEDDLEIEDVEENQGEMEPEESEEEDAQDDRRPHAAMKVGDCEPPEMTSLIFAAGLPNNKSQTIRNFVQDVMLYISSMGLPIMRFHADRGEFFSSSFRAWLRGQAVRATWSEPGAPQSNGKAEATVNWVKGRTRTLLAAAGLEQHLWPTAAETAAAEQRSRVLGFKSILAAPYGARVHVRKRPFTAKGPRRKGDSLDSKWVSGWYVGLSGLLDHGHLVYVPPGEGEAGGFLHTLHVRAGLVDPGPPQEELEVEEEPRVRRRIREKGPPATPGLNAIGEVRREDVCEEAREILMNWSFDRALNFLEELTEEEEFRDFRCGAYRHGGVVGITKMTNQIPEVVQVATRVIREAEPSATFIALSIRRDVGRVMHRDSANDFQTYNYSVLLKKPRRGGELWVELGPGDVVRGPVVQREVPGSGEAVYGQLLKNDRGKCVSFFPGRRHEVEQWKGSRAVLIGYTPQCLGKLDDEAIKALEENGFVTPVTQMPEFFQGDAEEVDQNPTSIQAMNLGDGHFDDCDELLEVEGSFARFEPTHCETDPRVKKAELSYTKDVEEILRNLSGPLDVVYAVSPEEVLMNLDKWEPSIRKEVKGIQEAVRRLLPQTEERAMWFAKKGVQRLPTKFVFTVKPGDNPRPDDPSTWFKRKARLVVCGNMASSSGAELYTEAAPAEAVRASLAMAAEKGWAVGILDVVAAFLRTPLGRTERDPVVVVQPPKLLERLGITVPQELWGLVRALYGLRESPRLWGCYRDTVIKDMTVDLEEEILKVKQGQAVSSWWTVTNDKGELRAIIVIYVDDFLLCGEEMVIRALGNEIQKIWETTPLSVLTKSHSLRFLGLEIHYNEEEGRGFSISQESYIRELLRARGVDATRRDRIPISKEQASFGPLPGDEAPTPEDTKAAQQLTGEVLWISQRTRPDLSYVASLMATLTTRAPKRALAVGNKTLGYVQRTMDYRMKIPGCGSELTLYCDAAFAPEGGKSHSGWAVLWGQSPLSWKSTRQGMISLSTAESELIAMLDGGVALLSTEAMLGDLQVTVTKKNIATDSTSALAIAGGSSSWRTRHLKIKASWLYENILAGSIAVRHCAGRIQIADLLTKALSAQRIGDLLYLWGIGPMQGKASVAMIKPTSTRIVVAMICCLLVMSVEATPPDLHDQGHRLAMDWDMVGWLLVLLSIAGIVAIWEAAKWLTMGAIECAPGGGARRLRKLQKLEAATRKAIEMEVEKIQSSTGLSSSTPRTTSIAPQPTSQPSPAATTRMQEVQTTPRNSREGELRERASPATSLSGWSESDALGDRYQVCVDTIMLMVVEEIKNGLREEGLALAGAKETLARRLADILYDKQFPNREITTTRQLKYILYLWRTRELAYKTRLKWTDINARHRASKWIGYWREV